MKNTLVLLATIVLVACAAPVQVVETAVVTVQPTATEAATEAPSAGVPSFEATTYEDPAGRFSFQYPASWVVLGGEAGSRGQYVQIASWDPGDAPVESLPRGESQLQVAVYQWDPKGDLDARLDMRRTAFINSGIEIVEETVLPLATGPDGVRMLLHSNGEEILQYFFLLGDEYLEFTALGDFQVLDEAIATFVYGPR